MSTFYYFKKIYFLFFLKWYVRVCGYVHKREGTCRSCKCWILGNWSIRWSWAAWHGCWEVKLNPLQNSVCPSPMIHLPRPWFIIAMLHSYVIQPVSLISSLLGKHFDLMVFVPVELMFLPRTGYWKHHLSCWWRCLSGFYFEKCVASSRDFTWASLKQTRCKHTLFTAHTVGSL